MVLFRNTKVEGFSEKSAMVWSCCHQYLIIYFLLFMLYEFVISIWIKINVHVYKLSVKLGSSSLESIWFLFTVNWYQTCRWFFASSNDWEKNGLDRCLIIVWRPWPLTLITNGVISLTIGKLCTRCDYPSISCLQYKRLTGN